MAFAHLQITSAWGKFRLGLEVEGMASSQELEQTVVKIQDHLDGWEGFPFHV